MGEAIISRRGGGAPSTPKIFGDGSDGDLYIAAGETVILPVDVPHQSIVEKNYKSITIENGGILKCSDKNAGLVLRCKGNCTIKGTIDQNLMAPKTNPNNNYAYPEELACGAGGAGGRGIGSNAAPTYPGGVGMAARKYGGGYSGGGGGGHGYSNDIYSNGGNGGNANDITVSAANIFVGGSYGVPSGYGGTAGGGGLYGGGGGGGGAYKVNGGAGGSGAAGTGGRGGSNGSNPSGGGGGGAGNYGGGVLLLYAGQDLLIEGTLTCAGGNGGTGGIGRGNGAGGGGAGGGGIYILHNAALANMGTFNVNGGAGGAGGYSADGWNGLPGIAGTIGTITIKKYEKGMTI